jgi:hypothetical protein
VTLHRRRSVRRCVDAHIHAEHVQWIPSKTKDALSWERIGSARLGTAQSTEIKLSGNKWKPAHCIGTVRHRPLRQVSEQFGILDRTKRSEGAKRAEGQYLLPSEGCYVFFCSNWFLMPIGSEAVRGRSPYPSRAEPCRADPIQCAPSYKRNIL